LVANTSLYRVTKNIFADAFRKLCLGDLSRAQITKGVVNENDNQLKLFDF
jgi:hypothetical protein